MLVEQKVASLSNERNGPLVTATAGITNEVLDVETLRAFEKVKSEDGSDFVVELIDLYLEGAPRRIQAIRKAAAEKEWTALKHTAHTLKGSSSTLGLRTVAKACGELENVTSSTSTVVVEGLVQTLESRSSKAREALVAERNTRLAMKNTVA